jgi:transglutaminase-like putative cysteine protease
LDTLKRKKRYRSLAVLTAGAILLSSGLARGGETDLPPGDRPAQDVFSRVADAGVAADYDGADYLIVYDEAVNKVKPSGVTYIESHVIYKMLTPAGCREHSVLSWNYDPQSSFVEIRKASVIRDGERIPVDVSNVHDLPAPQWAIYWKDRVKTLQLPRLRVNDGVEVEVFRKGFTYALLEGETPEDERYIPPMPGEYFDIVLFAATVPIVEKRYVLILPADKKLHSRVYNGPLYASTSYTEEQNEYAWWGRDLPARTSEPRQPAPSDYVAKVVMATVKDWEAKSRWFFDVNRDQFQVTDAIQAKVDEILEEAGAAAAPEDVKAEALVHWVAQNIRYSGQTMGPGEGFTLHPGAMIFEQRSGVCKDIAGMLITMMRAAGMDSYAAMTMAGSRIDEVPADQFNHCVCALRKEDGTFEMYDPTWVPYNNNIWSLLEAEQHYLIGTPQGRPLSRIDYSPPEESPLRVTHDAELRDDGTLEGTFRLEGSGALDGRLRRLVVGTRKQELTDRFARLLSPIDNRVEGVRFEYHDPADFSRDMQITIHYRIPHFARAIAGGYEFESPLMQVVLNDGSLFRAADTSWPGDRKTDVFLYYTQLLDGTEKIRLPRGYRAVELPDAEEVDETYAYFKGTVGMKGRELTVTQRAEVRRRQIPPQGYAGFKRAMDAAKEWGKACVRVTKGGTS